MLRSRAVLFLTVAARDLLAALAGQNFLRQRDHRLRINIADDTQRHVGRAVERTVAVIQRFRRDARDALDRAGDGNARGRRAVQAGKKPFVDLPVGRILDHADLLGDDAALLFHAFLRKVRHGDEGEQNAQVFFKMLGAVKVIARHRVGGKGVRLCAVLREYL